MAGFGQPVFAQHLPQSTSHRALPTGPCNHRDVVGTCGCRQFWDKCSAELHLESKERKSGSERSTYCVCGHHACFHEASIAPAQQDRAQVTCDGRCRLHAGAECDIHRLSQSKRDEVLTQSQLIYNGCLKTSHASAELRLLRTEASQANGSGVDEQGHDGSLISSTTGLPRVPDVCLLSNDRYPAANGVARNDAIQSRQTIAGLGLSMLNVATTQNFNDGQHSVTSTIPDDNDFHGQLQAYNEPTVPLTGGKSNVGDQQSLPHSAPGPLDAILEYNQMLHLDVSGDTIPNTFNPEDFIQSATEVATPSNANTPDLGVADQAVNEGRRFIEGLMRLTSKVEQGNSPKARPATAASASTPRLTLPNSPRPSQEQAQNVLRSASPQALQKLVSYLTPLHNLLNSIPNVANTMREHSDRISMLENHDSFNHVNPEDVQQNYDAFDVRILDLETRLDEHDVLHRMIDADQSSQSMSRRRIANATDSFDSNHSLQSTTSSALILAAMDRKEVAIEIASIKDRLDILEAASLPTSLNPWEVEIVLLPWGRDLGGIWFSPDEPMHDPSKATTQDLEEWTQARSSTDQSRTFLVPFRDTDSSPHPSARPAKNSHPFSDTESGWSSQEISEWVSGSTDELLSPKACGSKNLVYKRLKSRGFTVDVKFTSASAKDIQATISHAFKDLLERFKYTDEDESSMTYSYPGLKASFIPLRKVIKDSRLRFLTPAEMMSSALWTAQFLASGILMRVSGGKKRLYVTQREAYVQPTDGIGHAWTWQQIRILPRRQTDPDSQMDGIDEQCQVPEADAKEACWAFFEAYDAPPVSVNSSFTSHQSMQLSMRPADRDWRRSMTPSSILKNRQPISPLSEFHHQRPVHHRTVSASVIDANTPLSSKRRLQGSPVKQSSAPQTQPRLPNSSLSRLKRRRVTSSSSPRPEGDAQEAQVTVWTNSTPRRSLEPQSPFFSSEPQLLPLPRTSSDLTSRPSQRSLAAAYATPHSGAFIARDGFSGADTEADDDLYQDDDGEQSWRGLTTGEDDSGSDDDDAEAGAEMEPASFSCDGGIFGSDEDDDDDNDSVNEDISDSILGAERREVDDEDDDEEGDDIYDTLLGVLQS